MQNLKPGKEIMLPLRILRIDGFRIDGQTLTGKLVQVGLDDFGMVFEPVQEVLNGKEKDGGKQQRSRKAAGREPGEPAESAG